MNKNNAAWEKLFAKYDILNVIKKKHVFEISAEQIREFREPRLMAKFDHKINLPKVFADNGLSILPVARGLYCIAPFDAYAEFGNMVPPIQSTHLPDYIHSIDPNSITSEAVALNCALAAGIFHDFCDEEILQPTVSGRMGSGCFDFQIQSSDYCAPISMHVHNAQIEIDAALEGINSLLLVEAKMDLAADFIVRQVFYPFRTWSGKLQKNVRNIFLIYSNSIFSLYEYAFHCAQNYNSIQLVNHKRYSIEDTDIGYTDIEEIVAHTRIVPEPDIAFPQADSFERVINLCELLMAGSLTREQVTQEYAFDVRQTNYYTDAGRYLGLVDKDYTNDRTPVYSLTEVGRSIFSQRYKARQLALCGVILQHKAFRNVFMEWINSGNMPDKHRIIFHMKQSNLYNVGSESTYSRRSSTISSWLDWIIRLFSRQ